jgi:hypothetical protein
MGVARAEGGRPANVGADSTGNLNVFGRLFGILGRKVVPNVHSMGRKPNPDVLIYVEMTLSTAAGRRRYDFADRLGTFRPHSVVRALQ